VSQAEKDYIGIIERFTEKQIGFSQQIPVHLCNRHSNRGGTDHRLDVTSDDEAGCE